MTQILNSFKAQYGNNNRKGKRIFRCSDVKIYKPDPVNGNIVLIKTLERDKLRYKA